MAYEDLTQRTANVSRLPGNWSPYTWIHDVETGGERLIAQYTPDQQSFKSWIDRGKALITAPVELGVSAGVTARDEIAGAADRAENFAKDTVSSVKNAVTGVTSLLKWVVVGLVAFAVVYFLAVASPLLKPIGAR